MKDLAPSTARRPSGLDWAEVRSREDAGLVNTAPPPPGRTIAQILRANVLTRFNAILGSLFVVVLVVGPLQDALFGGVLIANTAIGIVQELRARRTLDRLAVMTAPLAQVVRGGEAVDVPVQGVVLDDVLVLRPGDQVAADGVVLVSDGLEVDESLITGESEPAPKEREDDVLSGSFVVAGAGWARTTRVGASSYAFRLEAEARRFSVVRSELQAGTNTILRLVTWVMVPVGAALIASQLLRTKQSLSDALRGSVAGVGAMVPEGLVLLTSVAFAVGALRLARRRVLVQELAALEGLARVDVLCIDKTGTLTAPGMRLASVLTVPGFDAEDARTVVAALAAADSAPNATLRALAEDGARSPSWVVEARVPFSSARKWSGATFAGHGSWVLGAPDMLGGPPPSLAGAMEAELERGRRVVLLGSTVGLEEPAPAKVEPKALFVLAEALREDTESTIAFLQRQGVRIKVLSGDAPGTVEAIARRAGIELQHPAMDAAGAPDLGQAIGDADVFGRVRPEQKLQAVTSLQTAGHVVAMVGDGVNDVPALKQADLSIAMGSGSAASRAVARIVLLDSKFSAVPNVLAEGRRVIANIERVANLFVTKTCYAAVLAIVVVISGMAFPFFPRHLTIVSTLTIGVPGFFLALAAGAPRAQSRFVHRVLRFTVPAGTIAAAATLAVYGIARVSASVSATQARTAAMLELCTVALWVLLLVARPLRPSRVLLVGLMAAGLVPLLSIPVARSTFGLQMPPVQIVAAIAGIWLVAMVLLAATAGRVNFATSGEEKA